MPCCARRSIERRNDGSRWASGCFGSTKSVQPECSALHRVSSGRTVM
jgi:hypothetical protein